MLPVPHPAHPVLPVAPAGPANPRTEPGSASNAPVGAPARRPTRWWLSQLERRRARLHAEQLQLEPPIAWLSTREHRAAIKFFNAALRAEQAGIFQAHALAAQLERAEPELASVLRLYGDEEGWHQQLLREFLVWCGGDVLPMGRTTSLLYRAYTRARHPETVLLMNLMFETIGATTYRLALERVTYPAARQLLRILTRDESFHVPLNVHFLRWALANLSQRRLMRLRATYLLLFLVLGLLPFASRPKARAFDRIPTRVLLRAYAGALGSLFDSYPEMGLRLPRALTWCLRRLGVQPAER